MREHTARGTENRQSAAKLSGHHRFKTTKSKPSFTTFSGVPPLPPDPIGSQCGVALCVSLLVDLCFGANCSENQEFRHRAVAGRGTAIRKRPLDLRTNLMVQLLKFYEVHLVSIGSDKFAGADC